MPRTLLMVLGVFVLSMSVASADTVDVSIQGFAFDPASLSVPAGTVVRWTNLDSAPHTSTSDSPMWDSGTLTTGQNWSMTFGTPGTYPYHCNIHPSMTATLTVTEAASVPGLGSYGMFALIIFLVGGAAYMIRRRSTGGVEVS